MSRAFVKEIDDSPAAEDLLDRPQSEYPNYCWTSPLAEAIRGARVGDVVVWERPAGDRSWKY